VSLTDKFFSFASEGLCDRGPSWHDHTNNRELMQRAEMRQILKGVKIQKLRFAGHLYGKKRTDQQTKSTKRVPKYYIKARGRPQQTWQMTLNGISTRYYDNYGEANEIASDREWCKNGKNGRDELSLTKSV